MNEKQRRRESNLRADPVQPAQVVSSEVLLPSGGPLHIQHRGDIYTLRRTRSGKLILTK